MNTFRNETEKVNSILKAFKEMPPLTRWISIIAIAVALAASAIGLTSCGSTRAVVHNGATGTTTEIRITTNNPTSVTASPNVQLKHQSSQNGKENETP